MAISNGSALKAAASPGSILSIGSPGSILSIGSAGSIFSIGSVGSLACVFSAGSLASIGSVLSGCSRWSLRAWRGQARQRHGRQPAGQALSGALRPAASPAGNGADAPLR
jgi:hypothetical protein